MDLSSRLSEGKWKGRIQLIAAFDVSTLLELRSQALGGHTESRPNSYFNYFSINCLPLGVLSLSLPHYIWFTKACKSPSKACPESRPFTSCAGQGRCGNPAPPFSLALQRRLPASLQSLPLTNPVSLVFHLILKSWDEARVSEFSTPLSSLLQYV